MKALLPFCLIACATSCTHLSFKRQPTEVEHQQLVSANGVQGADLFLGSGAAAQVGDTVVFDYTAWLADGTRIDSTLDRGVPVEAVVGSAPLDGWNDALSGMRANGKRRVRVPAKLAYGSQGVEGLVPPDADLDFEIHVLEVRAKPR